ncbi:MAG: type II toxin-antitoxin system RelE/ParE family toxin [Opitutaceae bacterium]|nr:type II toxin-antitoxin system RelE/ParE family toxin [Opitutaceae bacterium]
MRFLPIFHPLIEADVREGMRHYDRESPGLGARFRRTFYAVVDELLVFPEKYPVKQGANIRTRLLRPFPYLIFYTVESDGVYVLSVQYAGRSPAFLKATLQQRRSS